LKTYEIIIKPISAFGTVLKGDTIFGYFCWHIANNSKLLGKTIEDFLNSYETAPSIIFSSAYPRIKKNDYVYHAFKRPELPFSWIFEESNDKNKAISERKKYKNRKWMLLKRGEKITSFRESGDTLRYVTDEELNNFIEKDAFRIQEKKGFIYNEPQSHNSINRITGTTGENEFAPFTQTRYFYHPEIKLSIFVGIDEFIPVEKVLEIFKKMGKLGYGKDASTGSGKFEVIDCSEMLNLSFPESNSVYTLSPCVPEKDAFKEKYFNLFTRFGKHGDRLAFSKNPFKNPVIMADEGAVFVANKKEIFDKPYIGKAIFKISKSQPEAVSQGYSLYIPAHVEVKQ